MKEEQKKLIEPTFKIQLNSFLSFSNKSNHNNLADQFGTALSKWSLKNKKIRTLSLFTGGGGLDIGFHDAGFEIINMIELERDFCLTLEANSGENKYFGPSKVICEDIRNYNPDKKQEIDFIIGGPPCQTFSAAGRRAAGVLGTTEQRGTLFEEYVRILKTLNPKGFLFENVYGITGAEKGSAWKKITTAFKDAGYVVHFRILDAADYGVPQHRERMIIVGLKDGHFFFPRPTHGPDSFTGLPHLTAQEVMTGLPESESNQQLNGRYGHLLKEIPPGLNYSFFTEKMNHPRPIFAWRSKFSDFLYKADPQRPVRTIKAQGGQYTGPFHWDSRPFSVGEYKRLQTFPDSYNLIGNKQTVIHQIGNSVPPQFARILAISILEQVFNIKSPFTLPKLKETEILNFRKRKRQLTDSYQKKANDAILKLDKSIPKTKLKNRTYTGRLNVSSHAWHEHAENGIPFFTSVSMTGDEVTIYVGKKEKKQHNFEIIIKIDEIKEVPIKKITLKGEKLSEFNFTALWKALEHELKINDMKADLIQLNGYYQYEPKLLCKFILLKKHSGDIRYAVLRNVIEGVGVREITSEQKLAGLWKISLNKVMDACKFLKSMGYEVRNHNTNPQIPIRYYLIPYSFPTLNPSSVQLRKSLESKHPTKLEMEQIAN